MTGHALTRIYTAPKQEPADTTHRPSISIHNIFIGARPPAPGGVACLAFGVSLMEMGGISRLVTSR